MTVPAKPSVLPRWARTLAGGGAVNVVAPSSGEQDIGWTNGQNPVASSKMNWLEQNVYDWIAQLGIALPSAAGYLQGFESGTFPPTDGGSVAWTAPSVRFGSDLAYVRDTNNPITGSASANRPGAQSTNQNSSVGFDVFLLAPTRIAFIIDLLCNASFGDHFDFYIDGVLTAKWSTTTNATVSAGRFVSDVIREGYHTFDWRFVRGGSVSVASEKARLDAVNLIPESVWSDSSNRIFAFDDMMYGGWGAPAFATPGMWSDTWLGGQGSETLGFPDAALSGGVTQITSRAVAIGDAIQIWTANGSLTAVQGTFFPFLEALINLPSITNMFAEFGVSDGVAGAGTNAVKWVYDSAVGTDWRFKTIVGGVATTNPTGINAVAGTPIRLGITGCVGLTNGNGWLGMVNGQALAGAGANHMGSTQNLPGAAVNRPYFLVGSRVGAAAKSMNIDWFKFMAQRSNAALIG